MNNCIKRVAHLLTVQVPRSRRPPWPLAWGLVLLTLLTSPPLQAQPSTPEAPPSGASRSEEACLQSLSQPLPVVLNPGDSLALTLSGHPTFFWYMPQIRSGYMEFILAKPVDETLERETILHQVQLPIPKTAAIVGYQLPATLDPLEPGQLYRWSVVLWCRDVGEINYDLSDGLIITNWVERLIPEDPIAQQVRDAKPEQSDRFAAAGIWHEAITSLAQHRLKEPDNLTAWANWRDFLTSVELGQFAPFPIVLHGTQAVIYTSEPQPVPIEHHPK